MYSIFFRLIFNSITKKLIVRNKTIFVIINVDRTKAYRARRYVKINFPEALFPQKKMIEN